MLFRNHLSTVESNCLLAKNCCFRSPLYYIKEQPSVWILENSCFQSSKNIYIYLYFYIYASICASVYSNNASHLEDALEEFLASHNYLEKIMIWSFLSSFVHTPVITFISCKFGQIFCNIITVSWKLTPSHSIHSSAVLIQQQQKTLGPNCCTPLLWDIIKLHAWKKWTQFFSSRNTF